MFVLRFKIPVEKFQSCRDEATVSSVLTSLFGELMCLAKAHNILPLAGIEPRTSRFGTLSKQHKTRVRRIFFRVILMEIVLKRFQMSRLVRKPTICIGENKDADQLRGNREADQRL